MSYGPPPPRDESYQRGGGRVGGGGGGGGGGNQVYVGNLPWSADNSSLESLFSEQGTVVEAKVVYDRDSGRSRGFGFVTFESADEVSNAIKFLNGAVSPLSLSLSLSTNYIIFFYCRVELKGG